MKVLIIGGVAAGTKTAAKLKREDRSMEVLVLTKDADISYAGCGLPYYYVGGLIEDREELIVNTPQKYAGLTGVSVETEKKSLLSMPAGKVTARDVKSGEEKEYTYDRLVIATRGIPGGPSDSGERSSRGI